MKDSSIYRDIAKRGGGDIYIGVVGPVRSGKSTFIQRFLDCVVLPNIADEGDRARTVDQTPQSASGKTVMTTEPKFVPDESVRISIGDDTVFNVKMVDCVGYMVDGALGCEEGGEARMVKTPWSEEELPFSLAAEIGTGKVIGEHSTIGMLVTTDGTIGEIPRESYIEAEERVAAELKSLGKPYAIILNSAKPNSEEAHALAKELEEKYSAPIALVSCPELNAEDIREILALVLGEFPVKSMTFTLPAWCEVLPREHKLYREIIDTIDSYTDNIEKLSDIDKYLPKDKINRLSVDASVGTASFDIPVSREVFYETISDLSGIEIATDKDLISTVSTLAKVKERYEKVEKALSDVEEKGYGIVMPSPDELQLEEPKLVRSAGGFGVKVSANAESIHMIKAKIKTEFSPVVGTEEQSEEVVKYLVSEYEDDPKKLWESNMFGRSLYDMLRDGLDAKLLNIPDESREKLGETLEKILNDGANGLICILL